MGAHSLTRYVQTDKNLSDTWNEIYTDSRSVYGSDSYSGSFGTCSSVVRVATAMGLPDAECIARAMFSDSPIPGDLRENMLPTVVNSSGKILVLPEKWGAAMAIPVFSSHDAAKKSETVSLRHDICGHLSAERLLPLLKESVSLTRGSWIDNIKVVSDHVKYKKKIERAVGKFKTQWVLLDSTGRRLLEDTRFASEREAISAAHARCLARADHGHPGDQGVHVAGIRHKGETPTKISVSQVSRKTAVAFDVCTYANGSASGWYIFALVAS